MRHDASGWIRGLALRRQICHGQETAVRVLPASSCLLLLALAFARGVTGVALGLLLGLQQGLSGGLFFLFLALLNEIVWRNFSTDTWVSFKVFGNMPLTLLFTLSQLPLTEPLSIEDLQVPAEPLRDGRDKEVDVTALTQ